MDIYDQLAKEALSYFEGWIRPCNQDATEEDLIDCQNEIAKVFREGLKDKG